MKTKTIVFLLLLNIPLFVTGQKTSDPKKKWIYSKTNENGSFVKAGSEAIQLTTFNFFTGPDVENFKTTVKGFGSIGNTFQTTVITVGNEHFSTFLDLGASIRYYRFENNLRLTKTNNQIIDEIVTNPPYEFKNKFFSWSKNKMVVGYLTVPVGFDVKFPFANVRMQASYIRYLSGKHKLKYTDNDDTFENKGDITLDFLVKDENEKFKTSNSDFKDFYLNKNNVNLQMMITPKLGGQPLFSIGFQYDVLPFFKENKGPEIHEAAIVVSFDLNN